MPWRGGVVVVGSSAARIAYLLYTGPLRGRNWLNNWPLRSGASFWNEYAGSRPRLVRAVEDRGEEEGRKGLKTTPSHEIARATATRTPLRYVARPNPTDRPEGLPFGPPFSYPARATARTAWPMAGRLLRCRPLYVLILSRPVSDLPMPRHRTYFTASTSRVN